jgi:Phage integrase, N-terminal SAM-like domain
LSTGCQRSSRVGMAEGFIRQRGNAWQVIVHAGHDPVTGKRCNLTGTARTKREVQALRARLLTQVDEGRRPATDATVAQLLERWLEMADLAWSTRVTYKDYIKRTILPALGHLPLRRLDTATLDRFYSELRIRGGHGGRPIAPATVRQVHAILRRALDQAARWGWIPATRRPWPARRGSARPRSARPPPRRSRGCPDGLASGQGCTICVITRRPSSAPAGSTCVRCRAGSAMPVGERPRSGSTPISWRRRTDGPLRFSRRRSDAPAAIALGARYGVTASCRSLLCEREHHHLVTSGNPSIAPLTLASAVVAYRLLSSDCRAFAACSPLIRRPPAGTWTRSCGDEPSWTLSSSLDQELLARASRCARSASFEVSSAARSNSARASMERPSLASRSPRTLGSRW